MEHFTYGGRFWGNSKSAFHYVPLFIMFPFSSMSTTLWWDCGILQSYYLEQVGNRWEQPSEYQETALFHIVLGQLGPVNQVFFKQIKR